MRNSYILTGTLLVLLASKVALPQSLGEIARKEEERRKTVKTPSKVYTNESLKRDPGVSAAPVASAPPSSSQPASAQSTPASPAATPATNAPQPDAAKPPTQAKDETAWRTRISQARDQLERTKTLLDALQSRVNALSADFVNRDDPAQRAVIERDRQKALGEIERLKKEIGEYTKAVANIEEEARRAGVPPGWLR